MALHCGFVYVSWVCVLVCLCVVDWAISPRVWCSPIYFSIRPDSYRRRRFINYLLTYLLKDPCSELEHFVCRSDGTFLAVSRTAYFLVVNVFQVQTQTAQGVESGVEILSYSPSRRESLLCMLRSGITLNRGSQGVLSPPVESGANPKRSCWMGYIACQNTSNLKHS